MVRRPLANVWRPKSTPWLFATVTTSTPPARAIARIVAGGDRKWNGLAGHGFPPVPTAVSRFATTMSRARSQAPTLAQCHDGPWARTSAMAEPGETSPTAARLTGRTRTATARAASPGSTSRYRYRPSTAGVVSRDDDAPAATSARATTAAGPGATRTSSAVPAVVATNGIRSSTPEASHAGGGDATGTLSPRRPRRGATPRRRTGRSPRGPPAGAGSGRRRRARRRRR